MRLGFKAPQHYTSLLSILSGRTMLDKNKVSFIFDTLKVHSNLKYSNEFKELVSLVNIVEVYSNLLYKHLEVYLSLLSNQSQSFDKIEDIARKMCYLLNVLRGKSPELATIAEAFVLIPSLERRDVEGYVKEYCSINDIIAEADVVLNNLEGMAGDVSKLVGNETFMEWIKTKTFNLSKEGVRKMISSIEGYFTSGLARYKLTVDRLDEARKLYDKAAGIDKSIGAITNYLVDSSWILRVDVIKASNLNDYTNVAKDFENLWNEALKNLKPSPDYFESRSFHLVNYLVYLASIGRHGDVEGLLNKYAYLLNYDEELSVLTKLMLKILGYTRTEISSREIVDAYSVSIYPQFLPALKLALGIEADHDELAVKGIEVAIRFKDWVRHRQYEVYERVKDLDAKLLVQLLAPKTSKARLAFMLYSLANGDTDLARIHALLGSMEAESELLSRLFREAHDSCCDIGDEGFKLALLKLFYYHI
jgi:tetratricopeptide (TPR) repeat protein